MGLFDKIKNKLFPPKPEEWYYTYDAQCKLLDANSSYAPPMALHNFVEDYLKTLPNLKKHNVNYFEIAFTLSNMIDFTTVDELGLEKPAPFAGVNLLNDRLNPYLRFLKKIDHDYCGEVQKLVDKLIFEKHLPLDSDFLYDASFFEMDTAGYEYAVDYLDDRDRILCKKVTDYVLENHLIG